MHFTKTDRSAINGLRSIAVLGHNNQLILYTTIAAHAINFLLHLLLYPSNVYDLLLGRE